jgi:hypothetical protein
VEYTQFRQTLNICLKKFQENGSVGQKPRSGRLKKRTLEVIEEARQAMEKAPAFQLNIYYNNLVCLLVPVMIVRKDLHLFPYRLRLEYCQCPIFFEGNNNCNNVLVIK